MPFVLPPNPDFWIPGMPIRRHRRPLVPDPEKLNQEKPNPSLMANPPLAPAPSEMEMGLNVQPSQPPPPSPKYGKRTQLRGLDGKFMQK